MHETAFAARSQWLGRISASAAPHKTTWKVRSLLLRCALLMFGALSSAHQIANCFGIGAPARTKHPKSARLSLSSSSAQRIYTQQFLRLSAIHYTPSTPPMIPRGGALERAVRGWAGALPETLPISTLLTDGRRGMGASGTGETINQPHLTGAAFSTLPEPDPIASRLYVSELAHQILSRSFFCKSRLSCRSFRSCFRCTRFS